MRSNCETEQTIELCDFELQLQPPKMCDLTCCDQIYQSRPKMMDEPKRNKPVNEGAKGKGVIAKFECCPPPPPSLANRCPNRAQKTPKCSHYLALSKAKLIELMKRLGFSKKFTFDIEFVKSHPWVILALLGSSAFTVAEMESEGKCCGKKKWLKKNKYEDGLECQRYLGLIQIFASRIALGAFLNRPLNPLDRRLSIAAPAIALTSGVMNFVLFPAIRNYRLSFCESYIPKSVTAQEFCEKSAQEIKCKRLEKVVGIVHKLGLAFNGAFVAAQCVSLVCLGVKSST